MKIFYLDLIWAAPEEISSAACDDNTHRMDMAHLYNKVTSSDLILHSNHYGHLECNSFSKLMSSVRYFAH